MHKGQRITLFLLTLFMVFVLSPVNYAAAYTPADAAAELANIYKYVDDDDNDTAAIGAAKTLADADTDGSGLSGLINWMITAEAESRYGPGLSAELQQCFRDLALIVYSEEDQTDEITAYTNAHRDTFESLFPGAFTVEDLFEFVLDIREELPAVIRENADFFDELESGTDAALLVEIPGITTEAADAVLDQAKYDDFKTELTELGWLAGGTAELVVSTFIDVANNYDEYDDENHSGLNYTAELALAKAAVRSQVHLYQCDDEGNFDPGTDEIEADENGQRAVTIDPDQTLYFRAYIGDPGTTGRNATSWLEWATSNESLIEIDEFYPDGEGTTLKVTSSAGADTAVITAYRAESGTGNPDYDWLLNFDVTVLPSATLQDLTISQGTLTPAFDPDIYSYTASVANSVTAVTISVTENTGMDASGDIGTFGLAVGANTFEIDVDGGATHADATYTIVITRQSGGGGGGGVITPTVTGVAIKSAPDILTYTEGDALDLTGLQVTLTYSNGTTKDVALKDFADYDITVSPEDGAILDAADTEIIITVNKKTAKQAITVKEAAINPPEEEEPVLTDIDEHWAEAGIEYLIDIGAIAGYPDGTFRPDAPITRAEFAKVIVEAFELSAESGKVFADTADHWAKDYIALAAAHGIVLGYNDQEFGPDDLITREQMAIMIVKAAGLTATEGELSYIDKAEISSWAYNWVVSAAQNELMSGYTDNTFKPLNNATRAEAATVIYNVLMK